VYLGELGYASHQQFAAADGRKQMRYLFTLKQALPPNLFDELYTRSGTKPRQRASTTPSSEAPQKPRTRRAASFGEAREALAYVLGDLQRTLVPAHQNYQFRLKGFLSGKNAVVEWERDFVDVRFTLDGRLFIGEIKVTTYLTLDEAFRTAIG